MNNKVPDNTIIMGIDPGTNITGFGVIRIKNNQMELVDLIEFKLSKKMIIAQNFQKFLIRPQN